MDVDIQGDPGLRGHLGIPGLPGFPGAKGESKERLSFILLRDINPSSTKKK